MTTIYLGSTGAGTPVTTLNAGSTYTISYPVDQTTYPRGTYPNQWFALSLNNNISSGNVVNICGGGGYTTYTQYTYNGGNSSYTVGTNVMYLTFYLPPVGITITEQYSSPFTITAGTIYLFPVVATSDYISILPTLTYPITIVDPLVCFKSDTKILTDKGYTLIQDIRKGDLVKTFIHDYKPVHMISKKEIQHFALEERIKDQLYKLTQENYPEVFEDLVLTGGHSILIDEFKDEEQQKNTADLRGGELCMTDNKYLMPVCVDDKAIVYDNKGTHTIYHLALENDNDTTNYGIYANGILVESCSKHFLENLSGMEEIIE